MFNRKSGASLHCEKNGGEGSFASLAKLSEEQAMGRQSSALLCVQRDVSLGFQLAKGG